MCTSEDFPAQSSAAGTMDRRHFTAISAAALLVACAPGTSATTAQGPASGLTETAVMFDAPGGMMDGVFIHPASGAHPGVILWPDIAGLRPAKIEMARALAAEGYAVLAANPYYRSVAGQQFADFNALRAVGFGAVADWRATIVAWLDGHEAVDTSRGIGVQGYCMTGTWTALAAAAVPDRIKAAAAFHPGSFLGDDPLAAVNVFDRIADDAGALMALAQDDDAKSPEEKGAIRAAAEAASLDAMVKVYPGNHGWTVPDSPAYSAPAAAAAYGDLLALYSARL